MNKTVVVKVVRIKMHSLYKKRYRVSRKFKVHDEEGQAKVGDKIIFEECRPLSKDKKWKLITVASQRKSEA